MISNIIGLIIICTILYLLIRFKMIKLVTKDRYIFTRSKGKLDFSYKRFHGEEYHHFKFKKGQTIILAFDVKVESGELIVECHDRKKIIWRESFLKNVQGSTTFHTDRRFYYLKIAGKHTRGACSVRFMESGKR